MPPPVPSGPPVSPGPQGRPPSSDYASAFEPYEQPGTGRAYVPPVSSTPPAHGPMPPAYDTDEAQRGATRPRRSRKVLIIGLAVAGVLILLAVAGIVATTAFNRSSSFAINSCVKQDGTNAKQVACGEAGAFTVVSKEDKQENCADRSQPFIVIERGGKQEVLCLAPAKK
jgi:hypothetical protein